MWKQPQVKRIENIEDLPRYEPPGHSGTANAQLVTGHDTGDAFEMVHGTIAPGGHAKRHSHATAYQAMYVLAGAAEVVLGTDEPVRCGEGDIVRIPPGLEHEVTCVGPEPLRLIIVYAPPVST